MSAQETVKVLCGALAQTVDPDQTKRKQGNLFCYSCLIFKAESFLNSNVTKEGFPVLLLKILEANEIDQSIRQAGAIFFKNLVKNYWGNVRPTRL